MSIERQVCCLVAMGDALVRIVNFLEIFPSDERDGWIRDFVAGGVVDSAEAALIDEYFSGGFVS